MKKVIFICAIALVALASCDKKNNDNTTSSSDGDSTGTMESSKSKEDLTSIEFMETSFDFGKVDEGNKVEHVFKFKNTGEKPLLIKDARASCGCTVPEYTKDPVAPGAEGQIKVIYDSANKEGKIEKSVTVISNTEPAANELKIQVNVIKKIAGPFNNQ